MSRTSSPSSLVSHITSLLMTLLTFGLIASALINSLHLTWQELVWFASYLVMFCIRLFFGTANRGQDIKASYTDLTEKALLTGVFVTMGVLPLIYVGPWGHLMQFANYNLPDWTFVLGTVASLPYLWLFWRSHSDLGSNWSSGLEVQEKHDLVVHGIYQFMRHPMYAAIWFAAIAQPLLLQNWLAGFLILPAFSLMYFLRVPKEEAMMRKTFGDKYLAYCRRTNRLLPISSRSE